MPGAERLPADDLASVIPGHRLYVLRRYPACPLPLFQSFTGVVISSHTSATLMFREQRASLSESLRLLRDPSRRELGICTIAQARVFLRSLDFENLDPLATERIPQNVSTASFRSTRRFPAHAATRPGGCTTFMLKDMPAWNQQAIFVYLTKTM